MSDHSEETRNSTEESLQGVHWMPCSVENDGVAAVNLYFQPKPNDISKMTSGNSTDGTSIRVQHAAFRGRGLLAVEPTKLPDDVIGHILNISTGTRQATIKGSFKYMHEWEHESDEAEFIRKSSIPEHHRGVEILEIMTALHDPLPIE